MRFRFSVHKLRLLVAVGLTLPICPTSSAQDGIANKPLVAIAGSDSHIEQPEYKLITSKKDWTDVWLHHIGKPAVEEYDDFYNPAGVPEINFEKCMVITIFAGKATNVTSIEGLKYAEGPEVNTFQFRRKSYQTGGRDGGGKSAIPFGLFVVNRSSKPLVLEQDARQYKNEANVWKEVVRFPKR